MSDLVVTRRTPAHRFRQLPLSEAITEHADFRDLCGNVSDGRVCILPEEAHGNVPSQAERDAERVRLAGFTLEQIAASGDPATIHALARNTLEHMRRMR